MCAASQIGALNRQGMRGCAMGDLANASFLLHQALRQAQGMGLEGFIPKLRNNLGLILALSGRTEDARLAFETALAEAEARWGGETRLHASIRDNIIAVSAAPGPQ